MRGEVTLKRTFWIITSIILAVCLIVSALMLSNGSLETCPNEEQIGKAQIGYGMMTAFFAILEVISLSRALKKRQPLHNRSV